MELAALLGLPEGLQLSNVTVLTSAVLLEISSHRLSSLCPRCRAPSDRVHSYYVRTITDVPCAGRQVSLTLQVRKFRCRDSACSQQVFSERLSDYVRPWARKTIRLVEEMTSLGMAAGARGAETVAPALGMPVSDQTILRLLARRPGPSGAPVSVSGVDDFAFRRGRTYGTILLDLERRRVIELLPDRSQLPFALWLQQHPEVRFISRDRGGDYAAGATLGAPQAEQIADRFHLLQNAGEVLERCLTRHHAALTRAARAIAPVDAVPRTTKRTPAEALRKQERRGRRQANYERVVALHHEGVPSLQIAKRMGLARGTVLKYLRAACFPEMATRPRHRQIDAYVSYLRERWNAGEHNARALWREIRAQGYSAGDDQVRRVVHAWRADPHDHGNQPTIAAPPAKEEVTSYSARKTRWLLWKPTSDLTDLQATYVAALTGLCPQIADAQKALATFRAIVTERQIDQLDPWLEHGSLAGAVRTLRHLRARRIRARAAPGLRRRQSGLAP